MKTDTPRKAHKASFGILIPLPDGVGPKTVQIGQGEKGPIEVKVGTVYAELQTGQTLTNTDEAMRWLRNNKAQCTAVIVGKRGVLAKTTRRVIEKTTVQYADS